IPPGLGLTAAQRREVRSRARFHRRQESRFRPIMFVFLAVYVSMYVGLWRILDFSALLVVLAFMWVVIAWIQRRSYSHCIQRALLEMDLSRCLQCGYLLRGLEQDHARCPECGTEI